MYVNSKTWVSIFLFYGAVCFMLGFFSYLVKTDKRSLPPVVQVPLNQARNGGPRNLMVESEKYLAKFFTRFNFDIADVLKTDSNIFNRPGKTNVSIPVSANSYPSKLVFCFPEACRSGAVWSLIARYRLDLKTSFAGVKEIPIKEDDDWEDKLAEIFDREQPLVLIGLNLTHPGFAQDRSSDSGCEREMAGANVHLYFTMAKQWQGVLLPQMIANFSDNLNFFTLGKHRLGDRDVFEIIWAETSADNITDLERNLESLLNTLEQAGKLQTTKKI